jgi:hypothetical protein
MQPDLTRSHLNCPFCATQLIDAYHDKLWKDASIDTDEYYYCVRCELTFGRGNVASEQFGGRDQISLQTTPH